MFSDDSDTEEIHQLTINEHYAKAFEHRKEREELAKLKEKYGSDGEGGDDDEEDSEEDESEDEDGEELTPAVDAAILRTLARIKRKDPTIYEQKTDVFEEEKARTGEAKIVTRPKPSKSKPLTLKQHALASALNPESRSPSPAPPTYVQEQAALKKETIQAFHAAVDDDDDDDLLVPREKTKDEIEREEEEYQEFLQREVGHDLKDLITVDADESAPIVVETEASTSHETEKKKKKASKEGKAKSEKSKEEEDQQFLLDYILNRGWIDKSERRVPTYKEVTASSSKKKGKAKEEPSSDAEVSDGDAHDDESAEDDEEFEEITDRFESSYNFRFEEPDGDTIARYPRNIASGVRREDTTRKEARERRKQRKEEELLQKREEVKRLKALKMKEVRSKLEKIGREGGRSIEDEALQVLDLEADWDPNAHDRQMAELYDETGDAPAGDDEKPLWDDDIDITDIAPEEKSSKKKKKKDKKKKHVVDDADEGGVDLDEMDADVQKDEASEYEEWDGTEEMRKKALDKYMDELYEMEFNDLVGDLPTRFRYAQVQSSSFGLSPVEILLADDTDLNQYVGIKKYAPYRNKKQEGWDRNRNVRLQDLKEKIKIKGRRWGNKLYGEDGHEGEAGPSGEAKPKKRKGKKERMKLKAAAVSLEETGADEGEDDDADSSQVTGQKRKSGEDEAHAESQSTQDGPSKKRRRRHKNASTTAQHS